MSAKIMSFRDLRVYQVSFKLQQRIFKESKSFPREEMYSLTDQVRRSSRSIGANIAEAWQKRIYPANFISKLTDSDSEQAETQHWLGTALACGYIEQDVLDDLLAQCKHIGRMLGVMIVSPNKFCHAHSPSSAIRPPSSVVRLPPSDL